MSDDRRGSLTYRTHRRRAVQRAGVCLPEALPESVRIRTVDKFKGQEATVTFFSMASSSGDVPRGPDFLFSRNRSR
jgi:hypothetical protein